MYSKEKEKVATYILVQWAMICQDSMHEETVSEVYVKAFQSNLTTMVTADADIIADLLLCSLQTSPLACESRFPGCYI